jgi:hypothetical protein
VQDLIHGRRKYNEGEKLIMDRNVGKKPILEAASSFIKFNKNLFEI